jgi:hypothetical protein
VFTESENKVPKNSTTPEAKPNLMPISSVPLSPATKLNGLVYRTPQSKPTGLKPTALALNQQDREETDMTRQPLLLLLPQTPDLSSYPALSGGSMDLELNPNFLISFGSQSPAVSSEQPIAHNCVCG